MDPCLKHDADVQRYIDNELTGRKLESFLAHLKTCDKCRKRVEQERALSGILRKSRPLYSAPRDLRNRVAATLNQHLESDLKPRPRREGLRERLRRLLPYVGHIVPRPTIWVPALLAITLCLVVAPNAVREVRAASYVETAVSTHRSYLSGDLPLEIRTGSSEVVTAWLSDKLPFPFRLPTSQSDIGATPTYRLIGARLVNYRKHPAALITYEQGPTDMISLLVASSASAVVAGGDVVHAGSLTFHYRSESGFKVITWSTHGLSYALVSDVAGSSGASCLVCHQNMADHEHFKH